jgi:hypothetical protein
MVYACPLEGACRNINQPHYDVFIWDCVTMRVVGMHTRRKVYVI